MEIYFDSDTPTCRAQGRHKAELCLPSAEVIGFQATTAQESQGLGASAAPASALSSRSYRVQVKQTGAAAVAACDLLELVIGVWRDKEDQTLDYVG